MTKKSYTETRKAYRKKESKKHIIAAIDARYHLKRYLSMGGSLENVVDKVVKDLSKDKVTSFQSEA